MVSRTVEIAGRRLVILEEADYLRLVSGRRAGAVEAELPPLPARNRSGRRPATPYILASIARDIVRDRKAAGLTRQELAKLARIPHQTVARIESAKEAPTPGMLRKIERALESATAQSR